MLLAGQRLAERDGGELAVLGRHAHGDRALDELLVPAAVLDQVGDRDDLQPVLLAVGDQVGDAGHRPVLVHDLADDAGGLRPASRARSTAASVWPVRSSTPPAGARSGKTWPGWTRSCGPVARVDRDLDRARAVGGRDAGRDAFAGLDRDGERGAERRLVVVGHRLQPELVAALLGQAEADQPAACVAMKLIASGVANCAAIVEVALVLAVGVVDDDHELARRGCPRSPPRSWRTVRVGDGHRLDRLSGRP